MCAKANSYSYLECGWILCVRTNDAFFSLLVPSAIFATHHHNIIKVSLQIIKCKFISSYCKVLFIKKLWFFSFSLIMCCASSIFFLLIPCGKKKKKLILLNKKNQHIDTSIYLVFLCIARPSGHQDSFIQEMRNAARQTTTSHTFELLH